MAETLREDNAELRSIAEIAPGIILNHGISEEGIEQLVAASHQQHIKDATPRDAEERFMSAEAINARINEGCDFYTLTSREGDKDLLAGVVWFKEKPFGELDWTLAVRLYEGFVGKGLGAIFLGSAIEDFAAQHPDVNSIWLSTALNNIAAQRLYQRLGFSTIHTDQERYYMQKELPAHNPKIAVIGGGTGSFTVLSGLKHRTKEITAIVNMSDDGGSSGILRDELGVLPPGDARQCLVALSESDELRELFQFRLKSKGSLNGHSLGNILLTALEQQHGNFEEALRVASEILAIIGKVVPVTTADTRVKARLESGEVIDREDIIGSYTFKTERPEVWLEPEAKLTDQAAKAIAEAELVVIAPGNLYGSLAPALAVKGMKEALEATAAKKVYVANLVTKPGQTEGFMVHDFADEIERFLGAKILDFVLYNIDEPPKRLREKYIHQGEDILPFDLEILRLQHYRAIGLPLVASSSAEYAENDAIASSRTLIRHDEIVLADELIKLLVEG